MSSSSLPLPEGLECVCGRTDLPSRSRGASPGTPLDLDVSTPHVGKIFNAFQTPLKHIRWCRYRSTTKMPIVVLCGQSGNIACLAILRAVRLRELGRPAADHGRRSGIAAREECERELPSWAIRVVSPNAGCRLR